MFKKLKKKDFHYTVTSYSLNIGNNRGPRSRMWSVSKTEKQARYMAEHNANYMKDAEFEYIVIEKYGYEMSLMPAQQIQWYINDGEKVYPIDQPDFAKGIANYSYH